MTLTALALGEAPDRPAFVVGDGREHELEPDVAECRRGRIGALERRKRVLSLEPRLEVVDRDERVARAPVVAAEPDRQVLELRFA